MLEGGGLVSLMSRTRGWLTIDSESKFQRTQAYENTHSGKRDPDLLKTSLVGPSWMQTTKKYYTKDHVNGAKRMFKGVSSVKQNPREENKRAIFVDV